MTKRNRSNRGQATPKRGKSNPTREQYLLRELQRIGYQVQPVAPFTFFISRKAVA